MNTKILLHRNRDARTNSSRDTVVLHLSIPGHLQLKDGKTLEGRLLLFSSSPVQNLQVLISAKARLQLGDTQPAGVCHSFPKSRCYKLKVVFFVFLFPSAKCTGAYICTSEASMGDTQFACCHSFKKQVLQVEGRFLLFASSPVQNLSLSSCNLSHAMHVHVSVLMQVYIKMYIFKYKYLNIYI